jgi:transcriptional regulator with XRE-family HTH domain
MPGKGIALSGRALNGKNARVLELFLQDWTQQEIAAEVGLSQPRVSQILTAQAEEVEVLPREATLHRRLAQIDAKISYWSAIAMDDDIHLSSRYAADKRVGWWWDFRARLCGEYAPERHFVHEGQVVTYVIEPGPETEALK